MKTVGLSEIGSQMAFDFEKSLGPEQGLTIVMLPAAAAPSYSIFTGLAKPDDPSMEQGHGASRKQR